MSVSQNHRQIAISTSLGEDLLLLKSAVVTEQLGRPFQIEAELLSEDGGVNFDDIIGQNVTLRVNLANEAGDVRYLNGFVNRFVQLAPVDDFARYQATIVPWLWFLTRTSDCRIFQEKSVPDIIKEVFRDHGFTQFEDRLSGTYKPLENCVQYRETDFNFVNRLMEHEGIYYFFLHENGKHVLVLADSSGAHEPVPGYEAIPYRPPSDSLGDLQCITEWTIEKSVQPGAYSLNDFNFETVKTDLIATGTIARQHAGADFQVYDYPGSYQVAGDGETYAKIRIEELQAQHEVGRAKTSVRGVISGYKFTLEDAPREDQDREYLISAVTFSMDAGTFGSGEDAGKAGLLSATFQAIPADTPFHTSRTTPKPLIQGPQTAIVVGKSGEEIWTDKFGRVKVHFPWDRYSNADENSSCWIRVSQTWAGKKWGAMFMPRIGQEVIVEFLEGDPDRPIITGRVYNGECMPPYGLPADQTKSTLKSNSSKGGNGFNEIRFEDKKGEEQVFIHAEKDFELRAKHDHYETTTHDHHLIVENDQFVEIKGNRNETVTKEHCEKISGDRNLTVEGKQTTAITGDVSLEISSNHSEEISGDHSEKTTGNYTLKAAQITLEADSKVEIKVGGSTITLKPAKIELKSPEIAVKGDGKVAVSGAMAEVQGSGVLGLKGGMVKIN